MISEVPANVPETNFVAKSAQVLTLKRIVSELRHLVSLSQEVLDRSLPDMLRVKLCNFEFLLAREIHHKDIKWICAWKFTILDLIGHDFY